MSTQLPAVTQILIAVGTTARNYVLLFFAAMVGGIFLFMMWSRRESAKEKIDAVKIHIPLLGDIWLKYQVAQFSRGLSTLLTGGIPLVQAHGTVADSPGPGWRRRGLG